MRYGTFKYSEEKYGISVNENLLWALEVDWDNDNIFDGQNEATRMVKLQTERGKDYYISASGDGFEVPPVGFAIATLDNYDGRYDPWNTSSPLYGHLKPGKKVKLWMRDGIGGVDYPVLTGILTNIKPYRSNSEVDLVMDCGLRWLQDREPAVGLKENIYADDAIDYILDDVKWPSIWGRSIDSGPDVIKYWWTQGNKAKSEIEDLSNSGMGYFFVANDGVATYYSRHRADSPVMTITEDQLLKEVEFPQPWEFQRNIIKINAKPRVEQTEQDLWVYRETTSVSAGDTIEIWAEYTYDGENVPAVDVVSPAANTDYTMNTNESGTGTDLTSDFTVTAYKFSKTAKITIKNNSASLGYITLLKIRGKPIVAPDNTGVVEEGTGADEYPRTLELDLPWQQDYNTATDFAKFLTLFLATPQYFPTIFIQGRPEIQFGLDLYDKVTLNLTSLGINQDFRVGKIKHTSDNETCQLFTTEIKLFPSYDVSGYWRMGVSLLGVDTVMGW